jgi:hypothetical protein
MRLRKSVQRAQDAVVVLGHQLLTQLHDFCVFVGTRLKFSLRAVNIRERFEFGGRSRFLGPLFAQYFTRFPLEGLSLRVLLVFSGFRRLLENAAGVCGHRFSMLPNREDNGRFGTLTIWTDELSRRNCNETVWARLQETRADRSVRPIYRH